MYSLHGEVIWITTNNWKAYFYFTIKRCYTFEQISCNYQTNHLLVLACLELTSLTTFIWSVCWNWKAVCIAFLFLHGPERNIQGMRRENRGKSNNLLFKILIKEWSFIFGSYFIIFLKTKPPKKNNAMTHWWQTSGISICNEDRTKIIFNILGNIKKPTNQNTTHTLACAFTTALGKRI